MIVLLPMFCFLIVWGISLAKCELLTLKHGSEFAEIYKENTMLSEQQYWKVLGYSDQIARVYYVGMNHSSANILTFQNMDGQWRYDGEWETIWSTSGSASQSIWPYWWHFIYGGF